MNACYKTFLRLGVKTVYRNIAVVHAGRMIPPTSPEQPASPLPLGVPPLHRSFPNHYDGALYRISNRSLCEPGQEVKLSPSHSIFIYLSATVGGGEAFDRTEQHDAMQMRSMPKQKHSLGKHLCQKPRCVFPTAPADTRALAGSISLAQSTFLTTHD